MYFDEFCERIKELTDNNTKYNSFNYVIYGNIALNNIYIYLTNKTNAYYSKIIKGITITEEYVLPDDFVSIYGIYLKKELKKINYLEVDKFFNEPQQNTFTILNSNELHFSEDVNGKVINIVYFKTPTLIYNEQIKTDKEEYQKLDIPFCCENLLILKAVSLINIREKEENNFLELKIKEEFSLLDIHLNKTTRRDSKKLDNVY